MLVLIALLAGCGSGPSVVPPTSSQVLSVSLDTPNSSMPTQQGFDTATGLAVGAGARAVALTYTWSTLEPSSGAIDVSPIQDAVPYFQSQGLQIYLGIQVINTVKREVPPDLETTSFDDPQLISRFHALLDAIRGVLPQDVLYISIGNEVDVYLQNNPSQWPAYQAFYEDAVSYLHQTMPSVKVGVTSTWGGLGGSATSEVLELNTKSDVMILTYYPLEGDSQVLPSNSPLTDFPRMVALAGSKPVVMQEVGYPSGTLNASSEQAEAEFVTSAIQAWRAEGNQMPFFNYFILYDFDQPTCAALDTYYGASDPAFTSYLCTLGLRHSDGSPKAAWNAFVTAAAAKP
jgi:hypothetical protein